MSIMIAQIQNQTPTSPADSAQFLGQLAQFGMVSGIDKLQESFESLAGSLYSNQALQASSLVGRSVLASPGFGQLQSGESLSGVVLAPTGSRSVTLQIHDLNGELVRSQTLGPHPGGQMRFEWDGLTDGGEMAPSGQYLVAAQAVTAAGPQAAETITAAEVESVSLAQGGANPVLNLRGGGAVNLSDVQQFM